MSTGTYGVGYPNTDHLNPDALSDELMRLIEEAQALPASLDSPHLHTSRHPPYCTSE
eukprot:COSAG02_NODE_2224_length_9457_cov_76.157085_2_plen_57_part_00